MNQVLQWLRTHSSAVLATSLVVGNSGILGKSFSAFLVALASAFGGAPLSN